MRPRFSVQTTSRFEREYRKLLAKHHDLRNLRAKLEEILATDPYNHEGLYHIKKLVDREGLWRFRAGRFRFLYDIGETTVTLHYCTLRSEDTYR